jgi:hypothetical protein
MEEDFGCVSGIQVFAHGDDLAVADHKEAAVVVVIGLTDGSPSLHPPLEGNAVNPRR